MQEKNTSCGHKSKSKIDTTTQLEQFIYFGKQNYIQEAQLPQRDGATLVNSCYVSRGIGVRKVSNFKSDLRGH